MYNYKDVQFVGKYDFEEDATWQNSSWNKTFSVGIFKWELKNNKKSMKKGKSIVRISGLTTDVEKVYAFCEQVVILLDNNEWDGRKSVFVK